MRRFCLAPHRRWPSLRAALLAAGARFRAALTCNGAGHPTHWVVLASAPAGGLSWLLLSEQEAQRRWALWSQLRRPDELDCSPGADAPAAAQDGRPYVMRASGPPGAPLWHPHPPQDGDLLYCQGAAVGHVVGDLGAPGTPEAPRGCIVLSGEGRPEALAAWVDATPKARAA